MKKKEKVFFQNIANGKTVEESALLAGYTDQGAGLELISKDVIMEEITRLLSAKSKLLKNLALLGYQHLAFGSISDCISLITEENIPKERLGQMDLFMISEIKKPKDGAMEIKFFDRLKALEKLQAETEERGGAVPFYEALEKGAMALTKQDE